MSRTGDSSSRTVRVVDGAEHIYTLYAYSNILILPLSKFRAVIVRLGYGF
jgi:hypothetical protein